MARLFRRHPHAIAATQEIVKRCSFSLRQLTYQYPVVYEGGETPMDKLIRLTWEGANWRYPDGVPDKVASTIRKEFALIDHKKIAPYFLTVHEIVMQARKLGILCQGRGSAANSAVCYCLGITSVNPDETDVLFERFLSNARDEPPDIDVDFEHERREEIIQWIYEEKHRSKAALAATVISFRSRSAIREVGKALGLSPDTVGVMADTVWGMGSSGIKVEHVREAGLDPMDPRIMLALELSSALCGFPRHLSQHVGGFVLTQDRLDELVPIQNAAMKDRTVVEWDKDDLDVLEIYKVDVLALGMLTALRKSFDLVEKHYGEELEPRHAAGRQARLRDAVPGGFGRRLPGREPGADVDAAAPEAAGILRSRRRGGDRAAGAHPGRHGSSLPENRANRDAVVYPKPELKAVLERTLGVPLFQEQAMQIAIVGAGFSPAEADKLRRAMATFRHNGTIYKFKTRLHRGHEEEWLRRGLRRTLLQADRRLRRIRLPRKPCRQLRHPGLRLVLREALLPGGLRRGAAQFPADGVLCACPAGARCTGT